MKKVIFIGTMVSVLLAVIAYGMKKTENMQSPNSEFRK